jgi:transcriptional regulator with XRE-family HTH domain
MTQASVAANVRAELARKRITQMEVAACLGVSRQNVSQRLNGRVDFRVSELVAIAGLLDIPAAALLAESAA